MKKTVLKGNVLIPLLIIVALSLILLAILKLKPAIPQTLQTKLQTENSTQEQKESQAQLQEYTSKDLKIAFKYPNGWYVDEKDFDIMITSYKTKIGENKLPKSNEIKIFIDNYSGCFPTLEEDLIDPACGQGEFKNKIISKDIKQTTGGEFLKYTLDSYDENQRLQYFFQKNEKILDIEKHPDPSQFEKEFNQIVDSIRFLP